MKFDLFFLLAAGLVVAASGRIRRHEDRDSDAASKNANDASISSPSQRQGLTIHHFEEILFSEAESEYGSGELADDETNLLWNAASDYEWSKAIEAEENEIAERRLSNIFSNARSIFPFLVCDPQEQTSGYDCRQNVASHFGEDLMAVSNRENMTCFIASTWASKAEDAPPPLVVHPFMPEAKLQKGIADEIMDLTHLSHRLYSMFCPSQSDSTDDADRIISEIMGSIGEASSDSRFLRLERNAHDAATLEVLRKRGTRRSLLSSYEVSHNDACMALFSELEMAADPNGDSFTIDLPSNGTLSTFPDVSSCLLRLVEHLSVRPEICSVGIVPDMRTLNREAQWIVQSGVENELPFFEQDITGRGVIVGCSDSGLDMDHCYFRDATGDVPFGGSIDLSRRKVVQYVDHADKSDDYYGHGTHVVGTILGHRSDDGKTEKPGLGDGIARDAKVAFFDIGISRSWYLDIPRSLSDVFDPGRKAGARIHSVSWGSSFNGYSYDERAFDAYLKENEDFMIVVAAGNSGPGRNTVASPATCKNAISVGASMNGKSKNNMARFSSRGPTKDGRTKPDVVAPGDQVQSAAAGTRSCGSDSLFPQDGTSMSAPVVSGTLALIRQYFQDGFYPSGSRNRADEMDPSGQLVKAVLLNGGQTLIGQRPYDTNQNFGLISLIDSLPLEGGNNIRAKVVDRKNIQARQVDTIVIEIDKSEGCTATEISVTACWADPAAVPNCRLCVLNDLDLYVTREGDQRTYFANGRNSRDTTNNAERVRVPASDGDRLTIHVEATNLEESSQNYALVVTGCLADKRSSPGNQPPVPFPTPEPPVAAPVTAPVEAPVGKPPIDPSPGTGTGGELVSLETTHSGQTRWYGNMFDVRAKRNIVISSMSFHTDLERTVRVEVWTRLGTLLGSQYKENSWRQVVSVDVVGQGKGRLTKIPEDAISAGDGVTLRTGETHAFYVTMDTKSMIMSRGRSFGLELAKNDDLVILEGVANSHRFNSIFYPYAWDGALDYVRSDGSDSSIETLLDANTNYVYFGNFFDVDALVSFSVYELEIHTSFTGKMGVTVWTKEGTYVGYERDEGAWTKVGSGIIKGRGRSFWTPIPPELFSAEIPIAAGSTQAFYVRLSEDSLLYSPGANRFENGDAVIRTGAAIGPLGVIERRTSNVVLWYKKMGDEERSANAPKFVSGP